MPTLPNSINKWYAGQVLNIRNLDCVDVAATNISCSTFNVDGEPIDLPDIESRVQNITATAGSTHVEGSLDCTDFTATNINCTNIEIDGIDISDVKEIVQNITATTGNTHVIGNFDVDTNVLYVDGTNNLVGINKYPSFGASLDVEGDAYITGSQQVTGNLAVGDSNTFHVDGTNHRVGINTGGPTHSLEVVGNTYLDGLTTMVGGATCSDTLDVEGDTTIGSNILKVNTTTGKVGIGKDPVAAYILDVNGSANIDTNLNTVGTVTATGLEVDGDISTTGTTTMTTTSSTTSIPLSILAANILNGNSLQLLIGKATSAGNSAKISYVQASTTGATALSFGLTAAANWLKLSSDVTTMYTPVTCSSTLAVSTDLTVSGTETVSTTSTTAVTPLRVLGASIPNGTAISMVLGKTYASDDCAELAYTPGSSITSRTLTLGLKGRTPWLYLAGDSTTNESVFTTPLNCQAGLWVNGSQVYPSSGGTYNMSGLANRSITWLATARRLKATFIFSTNSATLPYINLNSAGTVTVLGTAVRTGQALIEVTTNNIPIGNGWGSGVKYIYSFEVIQISNTELMYEGRGSYGATPWYSFHTLGYITATALSAASSFQLNTGATINTGGMCYYVFSS